MTIAAAAALPVAAAPAAPPPTTQVTLRVPCGTCTVYAVWTPGSGPGGSQKQQVSNGIVQFTIRTSFLDNTMFQITGPGISPIQGEAVSVLALQYSGVAVGTPMTVALARQQQSAYACLASTPQPAVTIVTKVQRFTNKNALTGKRITSLRWYAAVTQPATTTWAAGATPVFRGAAGANGNLCGGS
jgi:hypothetical protein